MQLYFLCSKQRVIYKRATLNSARTTMVYIRFAVPSQAVQIVIMSVQRPTLVLSV